ncbi:tRNA pseudouridine(38-40) synthase TruA [Halobacteria archaeon AArc-m2/3/4]|uniref:tRNA pseudouridine synthase A n=2 Tax=Natronoglomus mannanivorans TaxID=2979990 RepID=A0ABT2QCT3_9EURY|nr:tRNA pseudouridine(38-40) synthase TruA [Halobacteria archaeon AArc-m2/3/4]
MRAFRVAYDGTPYYGFQRQPDVPTVEDAIFDALRALEVFADDHRPAGYAAAGRTDAGVSALAQTVAVEAPDWLTPRALNSQLPETVRAWAHADAPEDFHATHHADSRTYTYHLHAPPDTVDDERFDAALTALSGPHDFHNLTPDDDHTERAPTLEAVRESGNENRDADREGEVERESDYLLVTVRAGGFCRELVRRLVSLAHAIGTGDASLEKIDRVLAPAPLPGHEGVPPAPPEPLVLADVAYPDLAFERDAEAAASAREIFDRRRTEQRTAARISRQLRDGVG